MSGKYLLIIIGTALLVLIGLFAIFVFIIV